MSATSIVLFALALGVDAAAFATQLRGHRAPTAALAVGWGFVFAACVGRGFVAGAVVALVTSLFFARQAAAAVRGRKTTRKGAEQ